MPAQGISLLAIICMATMIIALFWNDVGEAYKYGVTWVYFRGILVGAAIFALALCILRTQAV